MKNKNIALIFSEECKIPSDYKECLISELDNINDGSCDNVYIGDTLDHISREEIPSFLQKVVSKIKVEDGLVHIKSPDLLQTCWYTARMNLDTNKVRYILYETNRKNCYTLEEIVKIINNIENTRIVNAHYVNGYEYSISVNKYEN